LDVLIIKLVKIGLESKLC